MQLNEDQEVFLRKSLLTMQIIAGALINGVVVFFVIAVFVLSPQVNNDPPLIAYIALGVGCLAVVMSFAIPNLIMASTKKSLIKGKPINLPDNYQGATNVGFLGPLVGMYQTKLIISMAILEGAAFFNLIAYIIEGQRMSLIMTGLLVAIMATKFATRGGLENWLADEAKSIDELWKLSK